jgi:hypothetical protein
MRIAPPATRRAGAVVSALVSLSLLSACQGDGVISARGSPAGQPIALESIEGPPSGVSTELAGELAEAARSRKVELVGSDATPRYRLKGYLTTHTSESGTSALAFVWDVYDAQKRRTKRVTGASPLETAAKPSWQGLDREALRRLAAKSMDEIAGFLSQQTPGQASAEATEPG